MSNINQNDIRKTNQHYTSIFKGNNVNSYRINDKMTNLSNQSNISDTTTSKTYIAKNFVSNFKNNPINHKGGYHMKKCSYVDFLELRKSKIIFNKEKRFKWQNLKDESLSVDPLIYPKFQKKKIYRKEYYGGGILDFIFNRIEPLPKPKGKKINYENQNIRGLKNMHKYPDYIYSRRVLEPKFNKDMPFVSRKKAYSQSKYMFHNTDGSLKSLFETTPLNCPSGGNKKLFKNKSYGALTINIFDVNYGQYQMPTHTKKLFLEHYCHIDHISNEDLMADVNECWKRNKKENERRLMTSFDFSKNRKKEKIILRNGCLFDYNKTNWNNSLSKIKRNKIF